jgi:hypothetical protein
MNKNFENLHLNNFEFIENTDNYIEDKVYNDLKLKVKKIFESGKYSCNSNCFEKIGYERFLERRAEFEGLDRTMWDMVIKGQLIAFQKDEGTNKSKKYSRFNFCFSNNLPICHATYLSLVGVGHHYLDNIKKHLQEHDLEERIHGNTGNTPKNMNHVEVNYSLTYEIHEFLKNYADMHGILSPGQKFSKFTTPVVFLPTNFSYASVYHDYVQAYKDEHGSETRIIAKSTFTQVKKVKIGYTSD